MRPECELAFRWLSVQMGPWRSAVGACVHVCGLSSHTFPLSERVWNRASSCQ